jgi:rhodanese-related sulfurtransferase
MGGMAVPRISSDELKRRMDDAATAPLIVDVRLKYPYEHSTVILPGALRSGPGTIDVALLSRDRDIVLYDSDPHEFVAELAAAELIAAGYRACALQGGIGAWMAAKLPIDRKAAPQLIATPAKA